MKISTLNAIVITKRKSLKFYLSQQFVESHNEIITAKHSANLHTSNRGRFDRGRTFDIQACHTQKKGNKVNKSK